MADFIVNLAITQTLKIAAGLALGAAVVLLLRSYQVWANRSMLGYSNYHASDLCTRLRRWAAAGLLLVLIVGGMAIVETRDANHNGPILADTPPVPAPSSESGLSSPSLIGARLLIPQIDVDAEIIELPFAGQQWDVSRLDGDVGHLAGSAPLGAGSNVVLAGHVTVPAGGWGPFKDLDALEQGDRVFVLAENNLLIYEVVETGHVAATDVSVVFPSTEEQLTLITCAGWSDEQAIYTRRTVVVARFIGTD